MTTDSSQLATAAWVFDIDDLAELVPALSAFLATRSRPPEVLAVGEPTHGEPAFPTVRNRAFAELVERGFRSIAIESDAVAGLIVDDYVQGRGGDLDTTMADGFSHGFQRLNVNRDLVAWMRAYNDIQEVGMRLAFYGFDAPLEMTLAPSPRHYLEYLHSYLSSNLGFGIVLHTREVLDELLGEERRWTNPAALMDAGKSIGASPEAVTLRAVADDLLTALYGHAPDLVTRSTLGDWYSAEMHGRAALGLLRYHAEAAHAAPPAERTSRMLSVRDTLMAENLLAIRAREQHRGPTLVFAHNRHLQRHPSVWRLGEMNLQWYSAGAILAALLGDRYTFVAGSLGASVALGIGAPTDNTFEGALQQATLGQSGIFDGMPLRTIEQLKNLQTRADAGPNLGYFPLDVATLDHCDAVLHVTSRPPDLTLVEQTTVAIEGLTRQILALPQVTYLEATQEGGAPESNWGNRFFSVAGDRNRPFTTIVIRDMPGFDEESNLDRPGVFRLNIELGRKEFQRQFGYSPTKLPDHRAGIDFAQLDQLLPHPLYGGQGWACILNPTVDREDIRRLLEQAHHRALHRAGRRQQRQDQ